MGGLGLLLVHAAILRWAAISADLGVGMVLETTPSL